MSSLQRPPCTFCSHSANFSKHTHTHYKSPHVRKCAHTTCQLPCCCYQMTAGLRMKSDSLSCVEAKGLKHVCLDSIQMCYVCSERTMQPEDATERINLVHYLSNLCVNCQACGTVSICSFKSSATYLSCQTHISCLKTMNVPPLRHTL